MESRKEIILGQVSYLLDELEAQRPWLLRIPQHQIEGKPMDSVPSLLDLYVEMGRKEWEEHVVFLMGQPSKLADNADLAVVLDFIQEGRRLVLQRLADLPPSRWQDDAESTSEAIYPFAFQITQSDGTFLRTIAERLHESMITFDR